MHQSRSISGMYVRRPSKFARCPSLLGDEFSRRGEKGVLYVEMFERQNKQTCGVGRRHAPCGKAKASANVPHRTDRGAQRERGMTQRTLAATGRQAAEN